MSTGEVDFVRIEATGLTGLTSLEISPDGAQLYATSSTASTNGTFRVFSRNTGNGELTTDTSLLDTSASDTLKLRQPTDVAVSADGLSVYVTSKKDKAISTFLAFSPSGTGARGRKLHGDTCNGTGPADLPLHLGTAVRRSELCLGPVRQHRRSVRLQEAVARSVRPRRLHLRAAGGDLAGR